MNKTILSVSLCLLIIEATYAQKFKSSVSHIRFFSDAPLEAIEATNEAAASLIDSDDRTIAMIIPIRSFSFKKKLMEEHFNENYLESDNYPNAIFKGKIVGWDGSEGVFDAKALGTLEMHGVSQKITIPGKLTKTSQEIVLETKFNIEIADYGIEVPKAVFYKIAEVVEVTAKLNYSVYEKN